MGAKNWVLEGDYKHKAVIMQGGKAVLNVGLMKNLKLDSSTIDQIEVCLLYTSPSPRDTR
mgnify:CR=1 FL=1